MIGISGLLIEEVALKAIGKLPRWVISKRGLAIPSWYSNEKTNQKIAGLLRESNWPNSSAVSEGLFVLVWPWAAYHRWCLTYIRDDASQSMDSPNDDCVIWFLLKKSTANEKQKKYKPMWLGAKRDTGSLSVCEKTGSNQCWPMSPSPVSVLKSCKTLFVLVRHHLPMFQCRLMARASLSVREVSWDCASTS